MGKRPDTLMVRTRRDASPGSLHHRREGYEHEIETSTSLKLSAVAFATALLFGCGGGNGTDSAGTAALGGAGQRDGQCAA